MEVTGLQFLKAECLYWQIVYDLPGDFFLVAPDFRTYLSPQNRVVFRDDIDDPEDIDIFELSITGKRRFDAIMGPHASTYVRAWLVKYYSSKTLP